LLIFEFVVVFKLWIFRKWDIGVWTESSWLRMEEVAGNVNAVTNLRVP
jgi:hypothetical protein